MIPEHLPSLPHITIMAALLYAATACRFLAYRPNGARHRVGVSLIACVLIGALLCRGAEILLYEQPVTPSELVIVALLCAAAWRAHGNLAVFFQGCRNG